MTLMTLMTLMTRIGTRIYIAETAQAWQSQHRHTFFLIISNIALPHDTQPHASIPQGPPIQSEGSEIRGEQGGLDIQVALYTLQEVSSDTHFYALCLPVCVCVCLSLSLFLSFVFARCI